MNKSIEKKINKILEKNGIELKYCVSTNNVFLNGHKITRTALKTEPFFVSIKKALKIEKNDDVMITIIEYAQLNKFDSTEANRMAKEAEKLKKEQIAQTKINLKKQEQERKEEEYKKRTNESNMEDWEKDMVRDKEGFIDKFNKGNMMQFFMKFPPFEGKFKYNEFSSISTFNNDLIEAHIITDLSIITEQYIGNNSESWVQSITNSVCHKHPYHPLKRALELLPPWDGKNRVETYLIDYIGALDTKLNRSMTKKFFYAMFERLFHPGCRFDHMLITYDAAKGTGKTSIIIILLEALMELAGNSIEDSGIISLNDLGFDKDTVQCLNKAWVAYVDELAKFLREEPEDVKKFITLTTDNARLSYERLNKNFPRHCVLYGSTNTEGFIKEYSDTCERRFWIVDCYGTKHQDKDYWDKVLPTDIKLQILSEAYKFWMDNPNYSYNELDEEDTNALIEVQNGHTTASKDNILAEKIKVILDFDYSTPDDYNTYYEWANEAKSLWQTYVSGVKSNDFTVFSDEESLFFGENDGSKTRKNDEKTGKKQVKNMQKMNKIPTIWVKQFIQEELGRTITDDNYINKLIDVNWQKNKNTYYNGLRGCFVRIL